MEYEFTYGLSTDTKDDDLGWPWMTLDDLERSLRTAWRHRKHTATSFLVHRVKYNNDIIKQAEI